MHILTKIHLVDEAGEAFVGPGALRLLEETVARGSIAGAAREMGMSYVKALRMMNRLEQGARGKFLVRTRGGNERGGTAVTGYATRFIAEYRRMEERIKQAAEWELESFRNRVSEEV